MGTLRKYLSSKTNRRGGISILVDMEAVYKKLDSGMTIQEVADELGISRQTLYSKHRKYQKQVETLNKVDVTLEDDGMLPDE